MLESFCIKQFHIEHIPDHRDYVFHWQPSKCHKKFRQISNLQVKALEDELRNSIVQIREAEGQIAMLQAQVTIVTSWLITCLEFSNMSIRSFKTY